MDQGLGQYGPTPPAVHGGTVSTLLVVLGPCLRFECLVAHITLVLEQVDVTEMNIFNIFMDKGIMLD